MFFGGYGIFSCSIGRVPVLETRSSLTPGTKGDCRRKKAPRSQPFSVDLFHKLECFWIGKRIIS
jgi:hypothetical protein